MAVGMRQRIQKVVPAPWQDNHYSQPYPFDDACQCKSNHNLPVEEVDVTTSSGTSESDAVSDLLL